jgi:hypothetical protein
LPFSWLSVRSISGYGGPGSLRGMGTPGARWIYLLLTAGVWLSFGLAATFDLAEDHHRGLVHPLDDAAERSLPEVLDLLLIGCGVSVLVKLLTLVFRL